MRIIGLTGGIGSGKTTVAMMFSELGIPVYIADVEAKALTNRSKVIRRKLIELLGPEAYSNAAVNSSFVAEKIFNDPELLQQVNKIIHPKVAAHFKRWLKKQDSPYVIKEAAILFENGGYKQCDKSILVTAPLGLRMKRLLARDKSSKREIEARMANQWSDSKKKKLADIIIENIDLEDTQKQVNEIHKELSRSR
ncbi:MAG: dephospho-CoA kinase [Bacteroidia bacterium]|nr:dephospho-CoA kinase [Bacteroidia bacterium]MBT8276880.1 dephospho-CoA kinase [Bacteroidia bacterium]NNF31030.1 dephospho-CoA kinase [Flavobacteriaceae bacterium]NNK53098.1 dephospho-CoA kinase [Flavobacteriaceae bacterium]NNM08775.1 dephospho-CoA kinase [Flavobacteriaceae bacterium]